MDNKIVFGVLTLALNAYGVPCFLVGNSKAGIKRIILAVVTFGIVAMINAIMGIIQGIKIITMSDEEFAAADKATLIKGVPALK